MGPTGRQHRTTACNVSVNKQFFHGLQIVTDVDLHVILNFILNFSIAYIFLYPVENTRAAISSDLCIYVYINIYLFTCMYLPY